MESFHCRSLRKEQASPKIAGELAQLTVTKIWNDGGMNDAKKQQQLPALLHTFTVLLGGQTQGTHDCQRSIIQQQIPCETTQYIGSS